MKLSLLGTICLSMVISAAALFFAPSTYALAWTSPDAITTIVRSVERDTSPQPSENYSQLPGCKHAMIQISGKLDLQAACVADARSFSLAYMQRSYTWLIRIGDDTSYHKLVGLSSNSRYFLTSGSGTVVVARWIPWISQTLDIYYDFTSHLQFDSTSQSSAYRLSFTPNYTLKRPDGLDRTIGQVNISSNGRYVVLQINGHGLARLDTITHQLRMFSTRYLGQHSGAEYRFGISDDGSTVVVSGRNTSVEIFSLTQDCGVVEPEDISYLNECKPIVITKRIATDAGYSTGIIPYNYTVDEAIFTDAHKFTINLAGNDTAQKHITVTPIDYNEQDTPRLDYLALGDSYSSGEGDTVRFLWQNFYRQGTDVEGKLTEKCHISSRSYPYLIAERFKLSQDKWNSVACSGAQVRVDYYGDDSNYLGQNDRLNSIKNKDILKATKESSVESFIPGRLKQLEFIKKYRPKIITVSGSGNDANFSSVLQACVPPIVSISNRDCWYTGSHGATLLGIAIESQYYNIRQLIREIKLASPRTTIYYIGYPQIIDGGSTCTHISGLSLKERKLFRAGTTYLNGIIKAAAESEGALYIDIEDVFESEQLHKTLCNPQPIYVNNFTLGCSGNYILKFLGGDLDCEESYHPNHFGHQSIADRIVSQYPNIMTDDPCTAPSSCIKEVDVGDVPVPAIFLEAYRDDAEANFTPIPAGGGVMVVQKGKAEGNIKLTIPNLEPSVRSRIYLTSEPIELGDARAGADGVLAINAPVPDSVPAGYHTLHVETYNSLGQPIELWKIVLVLGRDGDIDEDGLTDQVDKCVLVAELGRDLDHDDIDDGCDTYVSELSTDPVSTASGEAVTEQPIAHHESIRPISLEYTIASPSDTPLLSSPNTAQVSESQYLDLVSRRQYPRDSNNSSLLLAFGAIALSIIVVLMLILKTHHAKKHPR